MKICGGCRRHVREEQCPFCGATELRPIARRTAPLAGISRAKLIAGAAAIGATASLTDLGCSAGSGPDPGDASVEDSPSPGDANDDDAVVTKDSSVKDVVQNDGPVAAYGIPPYDSGGGGGALYGAPP